MIKVDVKRREFVKQQLGLFLPRAILNDPDEVLRLFGFRIASRPAGGDALWRMGKKVLKQNQALNLIRKVARNA